MIRKIAGASIIGVLGFLALKLVFGAIGFLASLVWTAVWLAAIGFVIFIIIKLMRPRSVESVHSESAD